MADAWADLIGRLFWRLGAGLIALIALLLWPVRFKLITLGAAAAGLWFGMRDEYRLIREEWRQDRVERRRLAKVIEDEWDLRGLISAEARARDVDETTIKTETGAATSRRTVLYLAGLDAIRLDRQNETSGPTVSGQRGKSKYLSRPGAVR